MKLIFVYNADGSFGATMRDTIKKIASPHAQECNLCAITYPLFAMDKEWSNFVKSLPHEVIFLHRDDFRAKYPSQGDTPLPAVFVGENGVLHVLISQEKINSVHTVPELEELVRSSLTTT